MKCISLLFLLKILGLEPIFNFDPFPNFRDKKCYKCKVFLNWVYFFFILFLVLYQPVLETILTIQYKTLDNLPNTLFYYIIPIHYYFSFTYFRSQRKKRIYESQNMSFLDNGNSIAKCMPHENTLIKSVSIISFFIILEAFITLFFLETPLLYKNISTIFYNISKIIITLSFIPGRLVLVINSHVFFFSFLQQLHKIQELKKKLNIRDWKENKKTSVAILCYEIIDIRYTISRLIQKTELMYVSTTIIGGISIGLIIEFNKWYYTNITSFIIFSLMQILFLSIIRCIGNSRSDINKIVHRRNFASKYILRKNDFCQSCLNIEKNFTDIQNSKDIIYNNLKNDVNNIIENGIESDKDISKNSKNSKNSKSSFEKENIYNEICIEIKDNNSEIENIEFKKRKLNRIYNSDDKKRTSISSDDIFNNQSDSLENSTEFKKNIDYLLSSKNESLYNSKVCLTNDEYIRCIYEWSTNTGSSVDWIILNNLLNENWESFGLFGIQFSNGKALTNAIITTSAIVASGSLLGSFSSSIQLLN